MQLLTRSILAAAMVAAASAGNAAVLFADNFDANSPALTVTSLPGWTVTGNIDLVGTVNSYGIGACAGICVDLDGTTGPGELLSNAIAFAAANPVSVSFDVSGNQRGGSDDEFYFELLFGAPLTYTVTTISGFAYGNTGTFTNASSGTYLETISSGRPYVTYTFGFTPTVAGSLQLRLGTTSSDNIGPILDDVVVSQVPEPATWALLITGFGMVGFAARRRTAVAA